MINQTNTSDMNTKKIIIRNKEKPIQKYRFYVQSAFALLCCWIGVEFYLFIRFLDSNGISAFYNRPPGAEGFLPISSMMSFFMFLLTGEIHYAHPAGMFIFFAILLVSLVFGKSFCSWLCPVGFISELVGDAGEKFLENLFKFKLHIPKWLDYPLRSLKYLLLGFFVFSIFFLMSTMAVRAFLDSPYNLSADIKMFCFFANISRTSLIVLSVLFICSIFVRSFWCRFLCPYGALLGIMNFISPNKIKRNPISCIDCGLCAKACSSSIKVDKVSTVWSDECTTCLNCVDVCPVENTLDLFTLLPAKKSFKIHKKWVAIGVVSIFTIVTGIGMITGHWQNKISKEEYLYLYKNMESFGHPTGPEAMKKLNEDASKPIMKGMQNKYLKTK
jgi:polyferredoxin